MSDIAIEIENLRKQYRLGLIGGTTLNAELQSWWAKKRGKEDPNLKLGQVAPDGRKTFWALDGINLTVKKGEALGIIGGNGAGKSTLLKILSRVTAPTEGMIGIDGRISSMLEVGTGFHSELTGRENIYMNGAILGMSKKEVDAKMDAIVEYSECSQFIDTPVKRYSSGMYVKLAFAVAANLDSEILIMDEVLAVGDMKFQKKCLGKMKDTANNEGRTVLYVSHNMETIRKLCSRCIVLNKGKLIYEGDTEEAINVYLSDTWGGDENLKYIFDNCTRRKGYNLGENAYIHSFEFLRVNKASFFKNEKIFSKVSWDMKVKTNRKMIFRLVVKRRDWSVVGMMESSVIRNTEKGIHNTELEFTLRNLAAGEYYLTLSLNYINENGRYVMVDEVPNDILFSIEEDVVEDESIWIPSYWGAIRFETMKILNEE